MADTSEATEAGGGPAQIDRGSYEIVRERLLGHARALAEQAADLNARRVELFGGTELAMIGSERIRSENNCVPRDIVAVGDRLLFGYNVFIGLRTETRVADVLSLHRLAPGGSGGPDGDGGFAFPAVPAESGFLADERFVRDFAELYAYYKNAELTQLRVLNGKLLAVFQISDSLTDVKVFRWSVSGEGVEYIDNRGERDHVFPASHDFEWTLTTRDDHVAGRQPHVNIADEVFVETIGGTLTIKVEDNTEDGSGIYSEPVDDADQALEDAEIAFARVGVLILLKIRPYREERWRYLIFNTRTQRVDRVDAIGQACVSLPEDHGIIFPGGYYLESGDTKRFDGDVSGMEYSRMVRSPNGEDVLYVFYERRAGRRILLPYNTIRKEVANPIHCHGYSLYDDGRMVVFRDHSGEPTRVHTMQIWQTPFTSREVAAAAPSTGSPLETIGNPDLVRGISDAFSLTRAIENQAPSRAVYEDLIANATRMVDHYHWLDREEVGLSGTLKEILATAELVIDEFEKVEALRAQATAELRAHEAAIAELFGSLRPDTWTAVDAYVGALSRLRRKRGELIGLRDLRYVDLPRIDELEAQVTQRFAELSDAAVGYLLQDAALAPYAARIETLVEQAGGVETVVEAKPLVEAIEAVGVELDLLTEVVGTLQIEDATHRTRILEEISEVFSQLNRGKAIVANRRRELLGREGRAEFAAEFKLFGQSVTSALSLADTPEKCDAQLSRLLIAIEDLEGRFSEFDEYLAELATKREDVYEAFSARKQALLDEIQRRATHAFQAATRILDGIARRAGGFDDAGELNAYFAADPMILKARDLAERLRELGDSVRADELESRLKSTREEALRGLRDRRDIYEDGDAVIVLGKHRFSVNRQPLDLTLVPRDGELAFHLSGTDYHEPVADPEFERTRAYWDQLFVSETPEIYRGEYLAACMLAAAERGEHGLTLSALRQDALAEGSLVERVRGFSASRYDEGYERGLHDEDAAKILGALLGLYATAGLLRYCGDARALAALYWAHLGDRKQRELLERRAGSLGRLRESFGRSGATDGFVAQLRDEIAGFCEATGIPHEPAHPAIAGEYLFEELAAEGRGFVAGAEARRLVEAFRADLDARGAQREFIGDLRALEDHVGARFELALAWLQGFAGRSGSAEIAALQPALREAAAGLVTSDRLDRTSHDATVTARVQGLLGQHRRIRDGVLELRLDEFFERLGDYRARGAVGFRDFQRARGELLERGREQLRLQEFRPKVMSAFVRNRLIDEVYLPLIGDNLAKQLGALGDAKRTDQMGLLLLISPPGYGKTTLMEYVADRLGMAFVKVNGPALGHAVTSLDPAAAGNAAARQEVEKINLAFEMANNVLLYVDDIQHTHPELLQKFISLCDGQRRVEGVWKGKTQTYDLRGKKFAICMAGNPYTESGEKFQIPDMLANRADIYNLGDILSGKGDLFALSYIENTLTSNPVLSPLAGRDLSDVDTLVRMARGENVAADELVHGYSSVELEEVLSVLRKLLRVQQVLLAVNAEYIRSASMDDDFRTEPSFKLQGSYRNMNKLAEKIVAVMNDAELEALIDDHYQGESQTLTTGAEHNLLKLAELRGAMSDAQRERWDEIKAAYQRVKAMGGSDDDPATRVTGQLGLVTERLAEIRQTMADVATQGRGEFQSIDAVFSPFLEKLQENLEALASASAPARAEASGRRTEPVAAQMADIARRLGEIGDSIAIASGGGSAAPDAALWERLDASLRAIAEGSGRRDGDPDALGAYLDRLDATLQAVVTAPRGGEVVQALGPGVKNLLDRMVSAIDGTLMPAVRAIEKSARDDDDPQLSSQLNRTLKNFDMLKELMATLTKIDTRELLRRSRKIERRGASHDGEDSE